MRIALLVLRRIFQSVYLYSADQKSLLPPLSTLATYQDEALLAQVTVGNRQAFEAIYQRYWKKLFTSAAYKLRSKQDAEDIVHEIFLTLWTRRETLAIRHLESYLATALKYMVIARKEQVLRQYLPLSEDQHGQSEAPQHLQMDANYLRNKIQQEMNALPDKCRVVFTQSRIEGKSNPEIARELQISRKTVEKHISYALRHLRPAVKEFLTLLIATHFFPH